MITCETCGKQCVGNRITVSSLRFNNHKSSLRQYERGQRGISGEHLYADVYGDGHICVRDVSVQIIDVTDVRDPALREGFWIEKLKCYAPMGLNLMTVLKL